MPEVELDDSVCAGFGTCSLTAPKVFGFDNDQMIGTVIKNRLDDEDVADVRQAVADCPTQALRITA